MARVVLSDTSPLIALSRVGGLSWLRSLFGTIILPRAVRSELDSGAPLDPELRDALDSSWWVTPEDEPDEPHLPGHLGAGEQACIRLGLALDGPVLVLLDDRLARREASRRGLAIAGTASIIGLAKRHDLIESAARVFEDLLRADFRIAPSVIQAVLSRVGE